MFLRGILRQEVYISALLRHVPCYNVSAKSSRTFVSSLDIVANTRAPCVKWAVFILGAGVVTANLAWSMVAPSLAALALTGVDYAQKSALHVCESPSTVSIDRRGMVENHESGVTDKSPMRLRMEAMIKERQKIIVAALEKVDGKPFKVDTWERKNSGGGGISCVLQEGNVFEKAGVNISVVHGKLPRAAILKMRVDHKSLDPAVESLDFFAAGLSMVLHPKNPMAPTVHLNYRYFETMNEDGSTSSWWFGGGTDLTPSYLFEEDVIHFHQTIKDACDHHDRRYYPTFKKWCDEYFFVKHRGESRGVGGIFFDDLDDKEPEQLFNFCTDALDSFLPSYIPIIEKRKVCLTIIQVRG